MRLKDTHKPKLRRLPWLQPWPLLASLFLSSGVWVMRTTGLCLHLFSFYVPTRSICGLHTASDSSLSTWPFFPLKVGGSEQRAGRKAQPCLGLRKGWPCSSRLLCPYSCHLLWLQEGSEPLALQFQEDKNVRSPEGLVQCLALSRYLGK